MDEFLSDFDKLKSELHTICKDINKLNADIISARTELSKMTPVYRDFPSLVERCVFLEKTIQTSDEKLSILKPLNDDLYKKYEEMRKIRDSDYVCISNGRYHDNIYILESEYNKILDGYRSTDMSIDRLEYNINLLTWRLGGDVYNNKYAAVRTTDCNELLALYKNALSSKQEPQSWFKKMFKISDYWW